VLDQMSLLPYGNSLSAKPLGLRGPFRIHGASRANPQGSASRAQGFRTVTTGLAVGLVLGFRHLRSRRVIRRLVTMRWQPPMGGKDLPKALSATDGMKPEAAPEEVFTTDTITKRMPKILDSVLSKMPSDFKTPPVLEGVKQLQEEMRSNAQLKLLESSSARVGAANWNPHLSEFIEKGEGWHTAPWWLVENYMYKRLLEELDKCEAAATYDPFAPVKMEALKQAEESLNASLAPLMEFVTTASVDEALDATLLRSLWGNQADLSLSAGEVAETKGGALENLVSDRRSTALTLLKTAKEVILVLDNHGLEVLCDLVFVDSILRLTDASVVLHVKDAPVFVSDVTEKDVPEILDWLTLRAPELAERLKGSMASKRLSVKAHGFYTGGKAFWELPEDLQADYAEAVVVLKGDANYRRLLGDLHWPYDTDFVDYAKSWWKGFGLICLRTMKSGVALDITPEEQRRVKELHPEDWLTSGTYGQVLAFQR